MKNKITPWDILNYSLQNIFFKGIEVDIAGVQKSEETIANFQWFLRRPSPLNVFWAVWPLPSMVLRWFLMLLPSLSMVFNGSGPLVKRCDGFNGSLWSSFHICQRQSWSRTAAAGVGCLVLELLPVCFVQLLNSFSNIFKLITITLQHLWLVNYMLSFIDAHASRAPSLVSP